MARGPVNQALLESNYQQPGDIYLDTKTEGAFQVLADQINENAAIFNADGSTFIPSPAVSGLVSLTVYTQIAEIETQIQSAIGGVVPPGSVNSGMIQNGAITHAKLEASEQTASVGGILYAYSNLGGF